MPLGTHMAAIPIALIKILALLQVHIQVFGFECFPELSVINSERLIELQHPILIRRRTVSGEFTLERYFFTFATGFLDGNRRIQLGGGNCWGQKEGGSKDG